MGFLLPSFIVAFIVTNVFFMLALARGELPVFLLMAEGFLMIFAGILGQWS